MASTDLEGLRWAVETLHWAKQRKAELKELEDQARLAVETALGDNDTGSLDGHDVVTWKYHKRAALDQQALKQTFPDVYEVCRKTTEVRRFEVVDPES
jgi:predicted phage-related endonuclease